METAEQKHGRPPDLLDWVIGRNHSFQAAKRVSVLEASVEIPLFSHWEKEGKGVRTPVNVFRTSMAELRCDLTSHGKMHQVREKRRLAREQWVDVDDYEEML